MYHYAVRTMFQQVRKPSTGDPAGPKLPTFGSRRFEEFWAGRFSGCIQGRPGGQGVEVHVVAPSMFGEASGTLFLV